MRIKIFYINKKLITTIYAVITYMLFIQHGYSESYIEQFKYSDQFHERPLILDFNEGISGIIKISPKGGAFSNYSWITVNKSLKKISNRENWLYERLTNEIQHLASIERVLRGPDSPLLETIFDTARTSLPDIDDTIAKATISPDHFCEHPKLGYNKQGEFMQLYCKYPLGMFKYYIVLRLQNINDMDYYLCISSLNQKRLRELIEIANSISLVKNNYED